MPIRRVLWTMHALERLAQRGLTRELVERAVREGHALRLPNVGKADWWVDGGDFVVVYDHPLIGMADAARIVTAWKKRDGRKRRVRLLPDMHEGYPDQ